VFVLNYSGTAPGFYPNFFAGTNVFWNNTLLGNPVAVLVRDEAGNVVDFVCAVDANPAQITLPMPIPAEEWVGNPIPANNNQNLTYQRVGIVDHNNRADWVVMTNSFNRLNPGLMLPFQPLNPVALSPASVTNFVGGIWQGQCIVQQDVPRLLMLADDGQRHYGFSSPFGVIAVNDVALAVSTAPNSAIIGDNIIYLVTITNTGPMLATSVIVEDQLPNGTAFVSALSSQGACANVGGIIFCNLGLLPAGSSAEVQIVLNATATGTVSNLVTVSRGETEAYLADNSVLALTDVNLPLLSILGTTVSEGNSGTTNAVFPVRLSAPCQLPVSVDFTTSNSTAEAGTDYIGATGTVVFAPGTTNQNIIVKVIGDTVFESIESFFVFLSAPTNAGIAIGQARGRINNDDPQPGLFINDVSLTESAPGTFTNAIFTVRLAGLTALPVSLGFATRDGTALAGIDYEATAGTLAFAPGVTNQTIAVPVIGNFVFKSNATFSVILSNSSQAVINRGQGICTIHDNGASQLDHFVLSLVPSPQYTGIPFIGSIVAQDSRNNFFRDFNGRAALSAIADSMPVNIGNGSDLWEYPLGTLYHDSRTQTIYLAAEIGQPGHITALALNVQTPPGQTLSNWTIRLKHTLLEAYAQPAWETNGWDTVYQHDEKISLTGWVTFFFNHAFVYNGTNNLLLDLSFNNSSYTIDGQCFATATKSPRSLFFRTDSAFGSPLNWSGTGSPPPLVTNAVPNVRLLLENPLPMTPTNFVQFTNGFWSGPISITEAASNVFLRVIDGASHLGTGNFFSVASSVDSDGDGLPDAWELLYFGSTHAAGGGPNDDPDGDGLSNLEEFRAATNPLDSSSVLRLRVLQFDRTTLLLSFGSVAGKSYRIESADDLSKNVWVSVADNILGTGAKVEITDKPAVGQRARFYRVVVR
jgi:uncharacterized repeat protein (TIGR01451 family)